MNFKKIKNIITEIRTLPKITVSMGGDEYGNKFFPYFTKPHPRYFLFKNKTLGVALINLSDFKSPQEYTKSVNGKNSAAYFSRKAIKLGYHFKSIIPNQFVEQIYLINTSASQRQGVEMEISYKEKKNDYPLDKYNNYFGVFKEDRLVAYLWLVQTGELVLVNRILGHAEHLDGGIMYLLLTSFTEHVITTIPKAKVIMYDTLFGASTGLKMFKNRCGFKPYKVNWIKDK